MSEWKGDGDGWMRNERDKLESILIITPSFEIGGAEKYVLMLIEELIKRGKKSRIYLIWRSIGK